MQIAEKLDYSNIISELINRWLCCDNQKNLYYYGFCGIDLENIYPAVNIMKMDKLDWSENGLWLVEINEDIEFNELYTAIKEQKRMIVVVNNNISLSKNIDEILSKTVFLQNLGEKTIYLFGRCWNYDYSLAVPKTFKVLAIIHCYNEEDIIADTIEYLLGEEIYICIIDNWSTDKSYRIAQDYKVKYPDKIILERFPEYPVDHYMWYEQLRRTEEIASKCGFDWYIHYDADEIRKSPWVNVTLRQAIWYLDSLGYNCIEQTVIDYRMTNKDDHIFNKGEYFDFRYEDKWIDQLKFWKSTKNVDVKKTGGHHVMIANPRIAPVKFINYHYPLRSLEQARKKIYNDRLPRFSYEKSIRGWHGHYDKYEEHEDFIYNKNELFRKECIINRTYAITLHTECGLNKINNKRKWIVPRLCKNKIVIFGSGNAGRYTYLSLAKTNIIVAWVDSNYIFFPTVYCEQIKPPELIREIEFDYIIIAIISKSIQEEILIMLEKWGILKEKILFVEDA